MIRLNIIITASITWLRGEFSVIYLKSNGRPLLLFVSDLSCYQAISIKKATQLGGFKNLFLSLLYFPPFFKTKLFGIVA